MLRFLQDASAVRPEDYRFHYVSTSTYLLGVILHVLFIPLFAALGVLWLAAYNVASCLVFMAAVLLNRRGRFNAAVALALCEVLLHAILAVLAIGWGSGFHYYILLTIPLAFFVPAMRLAVKFSLVVLAFLSYAGLSWLSGNTPPSVALAPDLLFFLNLGNIIGAAAGFSLIGYYYDKVTRSAETALLAERQKLRLRNEKIESELALARKIQLSLIPTTSPNPRLSFYYKPMEMVGGDFYDFILFEGPGRIGIFISDVSGHGVPAAFITSLIKGALHQAGEALASPAALLTHLNRVLLPQTNDNFVTAFYGIFDLHDGGFRYANAGHNLPLLVIGRDVTFLSGEHSSMPLAVLPEAELQRLGKTYEETSVTLPSGSRLLLYTDGLVEAVNERGKPGDAGEEEFGERLIHSLLPESAGLGAAAIVQRLSSGLIAFRGSEAFEDDVCLICLEC